MTVWAGGRSVIAYQLGIRGLGDICLLEATLGSI